MRAERVAREFLDGQHTTDHAEDDRRGGFEVDVVGDVGDVGQAELIGGQRRGQGLGGGGCGVGSPKWVGPVRIPY